MKVFFISPIGLTTPNLFSSFVETFESKGHIITDNIYKADLVFFDLHSRGGKYDNVILDVVLKKKLPICVFDAWDYGSEGMTKENWIGHNGWMFLYQNHHSWTEFMGEATFICRPFIWFLRKMTTQEKFPSFVHPYELIQYSDHDFAPVSKEQLFSRPYDFCFIGNVTPARANIVANLTRSFNVLSHFPIDRIPHNEWLDQHRRAKFYIEADGGGFGSERPYQLTTISPQLRQKNNQRMVHPWEDGVNCIEVGNSWGVVSSEDVEKIKMYLTNPDKLYEIYINGIKHMKENFSAQSRSEYILSVLTENGIK